MTNEQIINKALDYLLGQHKVESPSSYPWKKVQIICNNSKTPRRMYTEVVARYHKIVYNDDSSVIVNPKAVAPIDTLL